MLTKAAFACTSMPSLIDDQCPPYEVEPSGRSTVCWILHEPCAQEQSTLYSHSIGTDDSFLGFSYIASMWSLVFGASFNTLSF